MTIMPDDSGLAYALAGYGKKANRFDERRKAGYSLMAQGADASPILSPWQGAARLAQALAGGLDVGMADYQEKAADKTRSDALAQAMAEPDPQKRMGLLAAYDPETGARAAGQWAVEQAKQQEAQKLIKGVDLGAGYGQPQGMPQGQPGPLPQGAAPPSPEGFANNSGNIRSTAPGSYNGFATYPTPQAGASAHFGNFQAYAQQNPNITVAQAIAKWSPPNENNTQAIIKQLSESTGINPGMPLAEVLKDPAVAAQLLDAQTRLEKGGLPQGFNADTFMRATGGQATGQPTPLQINMPGPGPGAVPPNAGGQGGGEIGMPPAPSPQGVNGPVLTAAPPNAAPAIPDVPRPQPSRDLISKHTQLLQSGQYGVGQEAISKARAAIESEVDRQWNVDRERAKMAYEQQAGDYRANRDQGLKQPQDNVQNEAKMRSEFEGIQTVKDYRKASTTFKNAVEAAKQGTPAADLNLVYSFATMMDPGSVVREGEMGMVRATQSASDQVKGMVAALTGGQKLSPEARSHLLDQMAQRYSAYKQSHDELANAYEGFADRSGANKANIVARLPEVPYTMGTKPVAPGSAVPAGEYEYRGGKLVPKR